METKCDHRHPLTGSEFYIGIVYIHLRIRNFPSSSKTETRNTGMQRRLTEEHYVFRRRERHLKASQPNILPQILKISYNVCKASPPSYKMCSTAWKQGKKANFHRFFQFPWNLRRILPTSHIPLCVPYICKVTWLFAGGVKVSDTDDKPSHFTSFCREKSVISIDRRPGKSTILPPWWRFSFSLAKQTTVSI